MKHTYLRLHPTPDITMDCFQCLYVSLAQHPHRKGLLLNELSLNYVGCEDHNPCIPCTLSIIYPSLS